MVNKEEIMNRRKGMAFPIVLVVLVVVMILGTAGLMVVNTQSKFNVIDDNTQRALKYAEAGYNKYLWHLSDDLNFYSTESHNSMMNKPIEFEDGYFMLDVTKPSDKDRFIKILSTGWTKDNPDIKQTLQIRIRKKQFVHHVYVSNNDGDIWWTTGDESHGPYHTNSNMNIEKTPKFYDIVTYKGKLNTQSYKPEFYIDKNQPYKPKNTDMNLSYLYQTTDLGFPESNQELREWSSKDNMVFEGRTCIYINGDDIYIRNQNEDKATKYSISRDIPNKVIYVNTKFEDGASYGKFSINSGNVFISGNLKGKLTVGAEDSIYITHADPTNWYDYDIYGNEKPSEPITKPSSGGIVYTDTYFSGKKNATGTDMSSFDSEKELWTRYSFDKNDISKPGKDMLGLIANNDVLIMHYGWPKQIDSYGDSWDFKWGNWVDESEYKRQYLYAGTYSNIKIKDKNNNKPYEELKVGTPIRKYDLKPGYYYVWEANEKWGWQKGTTSRTTYDVAPKDITIHAAIFSVNEGFGYEDSGVGGSKGNIYLWGNITQKIRKTVGTTSGVGYKKKYAHDPRMFYDYPPRILEPTNVGWEIHEWKEVNVHVVEKP